MLPHIPSPYGHSALHALAPRKRLPRSPSLKLGSFLLLLHHLAQWDLIPEHTRVTLVHNYGFYRRLLLARIYSPRQSFARTQQPVTAAAVSPRVIANDMRGICASNSPLHRFGDSGVVALKSFARINHPVHAHQANGHSAPESLEAVPVRHNRTSVTDPWAITYVCCQYSSASV